MDNWEKSSVEVARILMQTDIKAYRIPVEEIIPAFDDAEASCLLLVDTDELRLEVKRRVAENKMSSLCDRNVSLESVDEIRRVIHDFGFANLEMECRTELNYTHYCIRQGYYENAQQILSSLCIKLESVLKSEDIRVYHYMYGVAQKFLAKIENKLGEQ